MTPADIQRTLGANGFPCGTPDGVIGPKTRAAVARFQTAWAGLYGAEGYGWLVIDGKPGPATQRCLEQLPNLSWHFTVGELKSKGDGTCYIRRELVAGLEHLRQLSGPFRPNSGYRDPAHNKKVGGAPLSMHVQGLAVDLPRTLTVGQVRDLNLFSGIGDANDMVAHVDLRHLSEFNSTSWATPSAPARWHY